MMMMIMMMAMTIILLFFDLALKNSQFLFLHCVTCHRFSSQARLAASPNKNASRTYITSPDGVDNEEFGYDITFTHILNGEYDEVSNYCMLSQKL